jgi:hypothetical protein
MTDLITQFAEGLQQLIDGDEVYIAWNWGPALWNEGYAQAMLKRTADDTVNLVVELVNPACPWGSSPGVQPAEKSLAMLRELGWTTPPLGVEANFSMVAPSPEADVVPPMAAILAESVVRFYELDSSTRLRMNHGEEESDLPYRYSVLAHRRASWPKELQDLLDPEPWEAPPASQRRRDAIPERVRHEVWRRDQGRCVDCRSRERLEFDHIIPVSKGGSNTTRNLELRCESCNRRKGAQI